MRRAWLGLLAGCLIATGIILSTSFRPLLADTKKPAPPPPKLKIGDMAPDFKLPYVDSSGEKEVSLSQYRGKKNVVLAFYIFAFTGG